MLDLTLCWICWLFCAGLPTLTAYPVSPLIPTDLPNNRNTLQWERYWILYTISLLSVTATAFTLAGCLCCRRSRRPKGFQDNAEKCKQEFKDGNSIGQDSAFDHSVEGLELDVPRMFAISDRVQFEPLPVDHIISGSKNSTKPKPLPLSTTFYEDDSNSNALREPCSEWFNAEELNVPREKLKYLREIGHGWFGKVVEGRAELEGSKDSTKNGGVVVRILTEEATTKEKAWFLGEATPYLKLRHQNVLALLGFCLETDPYLLLFESCPAGDLKGFLLSNRDYKSQEALKKENIPIRMALDIAAGLKHMHNHGFVHTDLSARNCLVSSDLSAKLGDYGTGVEKYPEDYYVVGDRALPIRWSAPESVECTDTTIETREITSQANMWSYAVLLWEIIMWGNRPYNNMTDEQVIQMLLSIKTDILPNGTQILQNYLENCPSNVLQVIRLCLNLNPQKRPNLDEVRQFFLNEHTKYLDFEQRWENLQTNASKYHIRSASLQDLRGSIDSDYWTAIADDVAQETAPSSFRLGLYEPVKNPPDTKNTILHHESGSETEEESWKGRIEQGVYTEKVKQKSKSVTDLMVLVHIDFDSDAELSMSNQVSEKNMKKKLPTTGSDSDLRHSTYMDEFDEALKKLRDPLPSNTSNKIKSLDDLERPKFLTLTMDQGQMPILRLSLNEENPSVETNTTSISNTNADSTSSEKHVLRLLSKGDPNLSLLRYVPDHTSSFEHLKESEMSHTNDVSTISEDSNNCLPYNSSINNDEINKNNLVDVDLWNHALDSALKQKIPGFSDETEFNEYLESSVKQPEYMMSVHDSSTPELVVTAVSPPDTPQSRRDYSVYNADDEFSNGEDLDGERKCLANEEEEDRKQLSTPDDEQSSDSGFRDKESCEEEENICPSSTSASFVNSSGTLAPTCTEEEQLQILFELDTILDAEYYNMLPASDKTVDDSLSVKCVENASFDQTQKEHNFIHIEDTTDETEENDVSISDTNSVKVEGEEAVSEHEAEIVTQDIIEVKEAETDALNDVDVATLPEKSEESSPSYLEKLQHSNVQQKLERYSQEEYECENENEDEDSSTMSLRSDNSYVSFGMEEEFVTAIRNELREKLPCAQMPVVEPLESHDDDNPSISSDTDGKQWDDDDDNEESSNQGCGGVGISIRYNIYGTPLSPIQEERESTVTPESLISNSRDISLNSKESVPSEDVLLVDTQTNKMILLEGLGERLQDDDRDITNGDLSEEENMNYNCLLGRSCDDKSRIIIANVGAPLPSPEEEPKWQQLQSSFPLPLPLPLQDDLMSTSFATERGWGSLDEDEDEDEEGDEEEEDEENSSSSGEFVWKRYDEPHVEEVQIRSTLNDDDLMVRDVEVEHESDDDEAEEEEDDDEEGEEDEEEEEEEEFTPSAWNATLAPHRSALRSPDKTLKSGDQKKSVWFKKQRYHCVYEYPKETLANESQGGTTTTWEPTSYADWEEMMDEPRLDLYPLDYDDTNHTGNEEFFVSSSNRPFQFQTGDSKYVSQFFPGAVSTSANEDQDQVDGTQHELRQNSIDLLNHYGHSQQHQLGELRHTRDRLKLNLSSNGTSSTSFPSTKQVREEQSDQSSSMDEESKPPSGIDFEQGQSILQNSQDDNSLPKVPHRETEQEMSLEPRFSKVVSCDNREMIDSADKCSVLARD